MARDKSHLRLIECSSLKQRLRESIDLAEPPAPCEGEDMEALESLHRSTSNGTMDPEMACALLEAAGYTIEATPEDCAGEVIDFEVERASRKPLDNADVSPATVLKMALEDITTGPYHNCSKVYVTLVLDNDSTFSTCNYRANLTRIEEVAFRQLGVAEAIDGWRGRGEAE
jgi:hypothetical protein